MTFDIDRFDAYVRGELSPEQRERMDLALRQDRARDGDLAREWDAHADAYAATARAAVRARVAAARARHAASAGAQRRGALTRPLRLAAVAAAVFLAIAVCGLWLLRAPAAARPEALAATYFEPAVGLPTLLGPAEDLRFESGMVDYKQGEYDAATAAGTPLIGGDINQDTLSYYLGVAALAAGRPLEAATLLDAVDDPALREGADWYTALALLSRGDVAKARPLLRSVSTGSGQRRAAATALLERLGE